jgi:hypothetical protein
MPKQNQEVTDFLIDQIEPGVREACHLLAALDYPIADKRELGKQLEKQGSSERAAAAKLVDDTFGPLEFPLMSVRGALEKLVARLPGRPTLTIPGGTSRPGLSPEDIERICRLQAEEARAEALARGASLAEARIAYLDAYFRCQEFYGASWAKNVVRLLESLFDPRG